MVLSPPSAQSSEENVTPPIQPPSLRSPPSAQSSAQTRKLTNWVRIQEPHPRIGQLANCHVASAPAAPSLPSTPEVRPTSQRSLTMQEKVSICRSSCSNKKLAKKYGTALSTITRIRKNGVQHYQKHLNRGGASRKREHGFNAERQGAMELVHRDLLALQNGMFHISKDHVFDLMNKHSVFPEEVTERRRERVYQHFRYVFGWTWQRIGRMHYVAPTDTFRRIHGWSRQFFAQHSIRKYSYVFFGDETAVFVDGEMRGITLAQIGTKTPKIAETNGKETVAVFLAGLFDVNSKSVVPLPPAIVFESKAKSQASSRILSEATRASTGLSNAVYVFVSDSGWVKKDIFSKILQRYMGSFNDSCLPTAIVVDDFTAHRIISYVPCEQQAPGENNCAIHVVNNLYRSLFNNDAKDVLTGKTLSPEWFPTDPDPPFSDTESDVSVMVEELGTLCVEKEATD